MATNSKPVPSWVASLLTLASGGVNQSSSIYVTVNVTTGWELQVPVQCRFSNVSADPIINVYASMDMGVTFDTVPLTSFSIARLGSSTRQSSIRLPTGQYLFQLQNAGPNSASFAILTQLLIDAINNA